VGGGTAGRQRSRATGRSQSDERGLNENCQNSAARQKALVRKCWRNGKRKTMARRTFQLDKKKKACFGRLYYGEAGNCWVGTTASDRRGTRTPLQPKGGTWSNGSAAWGKPSSWASIPPNMSDADPRKLQVAAPARRPRKGDTLGRPRLSEKGRVIETGRVQQQVVSRGQFQIRIKMFLERGRQGGMPEALPRTG